MIELAKYMEKFPDIVNVIQNKFRIIHTSIRYMKTAG